MTFLPTMSKLTIARECVLPWRSSLKWPRTNSGKFAGFGRAVSSAAECIAVMGDAPVREIADANNLGEADFTRLEHAAFYLRDLLNGAWGDDRLRKAETSWAFDAVTGACRELPGYGSRDYSKRRDSEFVGTDDLTRIGADGRLMVADYKSGRYTADEDPLHYPQLRALALCAARVLGFNEVDVALIQVSDTGCHVKARTMDCFDLEAAEAELRDIYARIMAPGIVEPRAGKHCHNHYCPIIAECPATKAAMVALEDAPALVPHIRDAEHAAWTRERIRAAERALQQVKDAVDEFASREPVPCGNGKYYGKIEKTKRTLQVNGDVMRILEELGAADAVEHKVTQAALKRAITANSERGQAAASMRAAMAAIEEAGGIREYSYVGFGEFTKADGAAE